MKNIIITALILILAYFYFVYPTATVEISPVVDIAREEILLQGDPGNIERKKDFLPLYPVEIEIEGKKEIKTTGRKFEGLSHAEGQVQIINENSTKLHIGAGTLLTTEDGVKFEILKSTVVPPLEVEYLMNVPVEKKAGQAEVAIRALEKGTGANVDAGCINNFVDKIKGAYVVNPEPTGGGKDREISFVCKKDIENIKNKLEEEIKAGLADSVSREYGGEYRLIENSVQYKLPQFDLTLSTGEESEILEASGKINAAGFLLNSEEIHSHAYPHFIQALSDSLYLLDSNLNIEFVKVEISHQEGGTLEEKDFTPYNIRVGLSGTVLPKIASANIIREIKGLNINDAEEIISSKDYIKSCAIKSKSDKLPELSFAIRLVVNEPEGIPVFNN